MKSLRLAVLAFAVLCAASPVLALDVSEPNYVQGQGGFYLKSDRSGPYAIGSDGVARLRSGQSQGAASIATSRSTAGATSTQLVAARTGRGAVTFQNLGTVDVYLGPAGVTAATGFLLPGVIGASVTIPTSAAVFGVASTGTQDVAVLETY
jgi:hypothetical protein